MNGTVLNVHIPDVYLVKNVFPVDVTVERNGIFCKTVKIESFEKLQDLEHFYKKYDNLQEEIMNGALYKLGYK